MRFMLQGCATTSSDCEEAQYIDLYKERCKRQPELNAARELARYRNREASFTSVLAALIAPFNTEVRGEDEACTSMAHRVEDGGDETV